MEGGNSGQVVTVCADPNCETHHGESRQAREARERLRAERRKLEERHKEDLATRSRILTAILGRVSAPLTSADLDLITCQFGNRLPQEYRTILGRRHAEAPKSQRPKSSAEINTTRKNLDEVGYSWLLMEISLLDAAHNPFCAMVPAAWKLSGNGIA